MGWLQRITGADLGEKVTRLEDEIAQLKVRISSSDPSQSPEILTGKRLIHSAEIVNPEYVNPENAEEYRDLIRSGMRVQYFDDRFYVMVDEETGAEEYFESSTTILGILPKPILHRWRENVGPEEADRRLREGGERGTQVHHACYVLMKGGMVVERLRPPKPVRFTDAQCETFEKLYGGNVWYLRDEDQMLMLNRFNMLLDRIDPVLIAAEMPVWSEKHHYAGTLDSIWGVPKYVTVGDETIPAGRYLVDYKTGAEFADEHLMQLGSYYVALIERHDAMKKPVIYDGALVIYLNAQTRKDIPKVKVVRYSVKDLLDGFDGFRHAHAIWKRQNASLTRPKVQEYKTLITRNLQF